MHFDRGTDDLARNRIELCRRFKTQPETRSTPLIVIATSNARRAAEQGEGA